MRDKLKQGEGKVASYIPKIQRVFHKSKMESMGNEGEKAPMILSKLWLHSVQ